MPTYRTGLDIIVPTASSQVSADDAFNQIRFGALHQHGPSLKKISVLLMDRFRKVHFRNVGRHQMVRYHIFQKVKPKYRRLRQHLSLIRNGIGENMIKSAQPIRSHDQQLIVSDGIDIPNFASSYERKR